MQRTKVVIIAALGNRRPIANVALTLNRFSDEWDCIALAYHSGLAIPPRCSVLYEAKRIWGTLVRHTASMSFQYEHIALLLDDVIVSNSVQPDQLLQTLSEQNAQVISPGILKTHHMHHLSSRCLYEVHFIEIFFVIFTNAAWRCFHDMFDIFPKNQSLSGWGFDLCFFAHCRMRMLYDNRIKAVHGRRLNPYGEIKTIKEYVERSNNASCVSKHKPRKREVCMQKR